MRIVLNGLFWSQPNVGSGQYLHGLLQRLPEAMPGWRFTLLTPASDSTTPPPAGVRLLPLRTPFDMLRTRLAANLAKLWFEQIAVPQAAQLLDADLLHVPYAAPPLRCAVPVVTTVHDIIWRVLPQYAGGPATRAYFRLVAAAIRRAAHVITDSQHSRNDIVGHLAMPFERVSVVYLAAGEQYRPAAGAGAHRLVAARYALDIPFIYYVGGFDVRKNLPLLVEAYAQARSAGCPATLVLAGRAPRADRRLFPDIDRLIERLGLGTAVQRIDVPRSDGPLLYQAATMCVYPSRYEGFGLPPLEAMACGTPVVVSAGGSVSEVVGDAAVLVDPADCVGWSAAMQRLMADSALREELRTRGLTRAAQFSWRRVAQETGQIYQQLR